MDTERWQQIDSAFFDAAELRGAAREHYLAQLERQDGDLAREVRSLLAVNTGRIGQALAQAMADVADSKPETLDHPAFQLELGPFRATKLLGAGGMGVVYLGQRIEGDFEQQVALKVVRTALISDAARARFIIERRVLARLQHDRIARLIDGGVAADGVTPWFAMEFVDGQPLLEALAQAPLEERLRVFLEICDAVHYAHRNLVVHRDLKPSNILVDRHGHPKLLDFGIAKVLTDEPGAAEEPTAEHARALTPSYAAPEQLSGAAVTTATDVYTLGVLLYELLAGRHPFDAARRSGAVQQAIIDSTPPPPSRPLRRVGELTVVASDGSRRQIEPRALIGDLDNICLMALRKEPARRYDSAAELAADIRRYLDRRPVRATPDSRLYRFRKLVERHRAQVWTAALAAAVIVVLTLIYGLQLTRERDRARAEAIKASQVSAFLTELFSASDPSVAQGEEVTAAALLYRGVTRIEHELGGQPTVRADLLNLMGDVHMRLGLYDRAAALLEEAVAINTKLGGERQAERARALFRLGEVHLYEENLDLAERHLLSALDLQRVVLEQPSSEVADTLDLLGRLARLRRQAEVAAARHREALDIRRALFADDSLPVSESLQSLAMLHHAQGRPEKAIELTRQALDIRRALLGTDHPETVELQQNLATSLQRTGALEEALAMFAETLTSTRQAYGEDHQRVGWILSGMAYSLQQLGRLGEAIDHDQQAVDLLRRRGPVPGAVSPLVQLARHLTQAGRLAEAEEAAREALEWLDDSDQNPSPQRSNVLVDLGTILTLQHRFEEAEEALRQTLRLDIDTYGEDHPYVAQDRFKLGDLARIAGRPAAAIEWLDLALERQRRLRPGANALGLTLTSHGEALLDLGRASEAERSFAEALEVFAVNTPEGHPDFAMARLGRGAALAALGEVEKARALVQRAARQLAEALGEEHPKTLAARRRLAQY